MPAQNGIIGSSDFDTPITIMPENDLRIEKSMAAFTNSPEYKRLKQHLEERIDFYQTCLPDGTPVSQNNPTPNDWKVANAIIAEFKAVLFAYEAAREAVEDAQRQ